MLAGTRNRANGAAVMRKARRRCNSVQPVRTRAFCRVSRTRQGMLTTIAADSPLGYRPLRCHRSLCAQFGFLSGGAAKAEQERSPLTRPTAESEVEMMARRI